MQGEVGRLAGHRMGSEIGRACIQAERVVGQLAGDEPALFGPPDHDGEISLAAGEGEAARCRDELDPEVRMALGQVRQAWSEKADAEAVGRSDPHHARGSGLGAL